MDNPLDDTVTRWFRTIRNHQKYSEYYDEAIRQLCNEFVPKLAKIICRIIPKKHQWIVSPDGIANEALDEALRLIDDEKRWNRVHFLDFCLRIASNNVADELRSLKCSKRGGNSLSVSLTRELAYVVANRNKESDPASAAAYRDLLEKFMQELPTNRTREVVSMTLQGFSAVDIAESFDISHRTVNRKIQTARKILRKLAD